MASGVKKDKAAAPAAALAETAESVTGDFRGIELTLPAKLPAVFTLDVAAMQAAEDSDGEQLGILWRLLTGILGKDQLRTMRDKVAEDDDSFDDLGPLFEELLGTITRPYGLTPGESSASAKS